MGFRGFGVWGFRGFGVYRVLGFGVFRVLGFGGLGFSGLELRACWFRVRGLGLMVQRVRII